MSRALGALLCFAALGCGSAAQDRLTQARDALFERKPEEALLHYHQVLESLGSDVSGSAQGLRARALKGAGDVYYLELRKPAEAAEQYRTLIASCPDAPEALEARVQLAQILRYHFSDVRGAIAELSGAMARSPLQAAELGYQVAKLYFEIGDYAQCEREAAGVAKRYPTSGQSVEALLLRAEALAMRESRRAEAISGLEELIARYPQSELQPHALYELGKLHAEAGEPEAAIAAWLEALKRHPEPTLVLGSIARARRWLSETTPARIDDRASAFDLPSGPSDRPGESPRGRRAPSH